MDIQCPQCKIINAPDAKFCKNCSGVFPIVQYNGVSKTRDRIVIAIFGLIAVTAFIYAQNFKNQNRQPEPQVLTANTTTPYPTPYKSADVGIEWEDLYNLCGKPDEVSSFESSRGVSYTLRYEYSEKRRNRKCWGIFTVRDNKVESIYRN
jgi:hypothetical protein